MVCEVVGISSWVVGAAGFASCAGSHPGRAKSRSRMAGILFIMGSHRLKQVIIGSAP
jgi:hypothetical protein